MNDAPGDDIDEVFARRIAHAIRTPLGVISGAFTQVSGADLDATNTRMVELGLRAGAQLERIADRLSLLARLSREPGHTPTRCDPAAIALAAAEQVTRARVRRRVTVDLEAVSEARERYTVQADATLLKAAIAELVDNGIRFARSRVRVALQGDDAVEITVTNDGPPPEGDREQALAPDGSGLGIGLQIASDVARRHGADLDYETRTGDETRTVFSFRFPVPG